MIGRYEDGVIERLKTIRTVDNVDEIDDIIRGLELLMNEAQMLFDVETNSDNWGKIMGESRGLLRATYIYMYGDKGREKAMRNLGR